MERLKLPGEVVRRLKSAAEEAGVSLEDFLLEVVLAGADPPTKARTYVEVAAELLADAEGELKDGDLRQAGEKVWGAAALAVKAYAYWREGVRLSSHGELWRYKDVLTRELGDWARDAWMHAAAIHVNFYEGWATREDVEKALSLVRQLVEAVKAVVK
ncbi:MAG: PaREP1 family protein [Thermoproteus sp.]